MENESRVMVREGGEVDGTQYYIVSAKDETGEHASAPLTADELAEFIAEAECILEQEEKPCGGYHPLPCGLDGECPVPVEYHNTVMTSEEIYESWRAES